MAFALGVCPVIFFLLVERFDPFKLKPLWKDFAKAALLGVLLAGILLVPYLHTMPAIDKDGNPGLDYGLSFLTTLQALVDHIDHPLPWQLYLGWITMGLFGLGILFARKEDRKTVWALAVPAVLILFCSTNDFLRLASKVVDSIDRVRFPDLLGGLSVPFILAVAGFGLENLAQLYREMRDGLSARWQSLVLAAALAVVIVCGLAVLRLRSENAVGFRLDRIDNGSQLDPGFATPDAQWISGLEEDHNFVLRLLVAGYHQIDAYRAVHWKEYAQPQPYIKLYFDESPDLGSDYRQYYDVWLATYAENTFAGVKTGSELLPCPAENTGGRIDVTCDVPQAGTLIVKELSWPGWKLRIDGKRAALYHNGDWLAAIAPGGQHTFEFRYDPWDVKLGGLTTLIGIIVAVIWLRKKPVPAPDKG
jgi:hypothetical protein